MGGKHFKNDDAFIRTAVRDVKRLERLAGLTTDSRLLDWGCGAGRLAVGVREHFSERRIADYHGVDVQPDLISWARENLTAPGFRFTCVDVANERYNPAGLPERTIAADPGSVDVFYAYSVFSHMGATATVEPSSAAEAVAAMSARRIRKGLSSRAGKPALMGV